MRFFLPNHISSLNLLIYATPNGARILLYDPFRGLKPLPASGVARLQLFRRYAT